MTAAECSMKDRLGRSFAAGRGGQWHRTRVLGVAPLEAIPQLVRKFHAANMENEVEDLCWKKMNLSMQDCRNYPVLHNVNLEKSEFRFFLRNIRLACELLEKNSSDCENQSGIALPLWLFFYLHA
ncbi:hypothetical protein ACTID9_05695 [Brevibacillus fluminis]|uniref:hypothetical protein n=1 Tax=Brevibacillus fluminis TaxID=511487 RepID=UPI003F88DABD